MDDFTALLARADAWYRQVQARHPDKVPCTRGCRDCCLGLFDISQADADLLREGLAQADPATRQDIESRARAILSQIRERLPQFGDTLAGMKPGEVDALCDEVGEVECPVLGPEGECRLYAHRPLTCRLSGIPMVDLGGEAIAPEGCAKCTLRPEETPRLDCAALRRQEEKILKCRYGRRNRVTLLIPQAVLTPPSPQSPPSPE